MPRVRVAWITAPNTSINDPIANGLGASEEFVVGMFLPEEARTQPLDTRNYTPVYFHMHDWTRPVLGPLLLLNTLQGFSNHDLSGTGIISYRGLSKGLTAFKPDIVLVNGEYNPYVFQVASWCRRANIPYIIQTETQRIESRYKRALFSLLWQTSLHRVFSRSAGVWAWSGSSAQFYRSRLKFTPITVIPPGIDTNLFHPSTTLQRTKRQMTLFLVVARLVPFKNISTAIDACALLPRHAWRLTIVGDGPLRSALTEYVKQLGLAEQITFVKRVPRLQLPKLYARSHALILPSYNEAIGVVVPEAMACGTPAVVSDTTGAQTYLQNRKTGYVFPTADSQALARILKLFIDNNHLQMRVRASTTIKKSYSLEVTVRRIRLLLTTVHTRHVRLFK